MKKSTFETLYQPLDSFLKKNAANIDATCGSRKLFFIDFFKILIFYYLSKCNSLKSLVNDLKTNDLCKILKLPAIPTSTLQDGFTRFNKDYFAQMYQHLLKNLDFLAIPSLSELGILIAVDGSLFPMPKNIDWAVYKKTKNAIKMHLAMNINQMIPVHFLSATGNSSERAFLITILEKAATYIADRGYFSFEVIHLIQKAEAFFVLRIKSNLIYTLQKNLAITGSIPSCIQNLQDSMLLFTNDTYQTNCRLISFTVWNSDFLILTNRFDLTTLQVIVLYAYRWQIELLFKYIKRTLNGIHLLNTSVNGINIQFYMLMIVTILQLNFKQKIQRLQQQKDEQAPRDDGTKTPTSSSPMKISTAKQAKGAEQKTQTKSNTQANQATDTNDTAPTQAKEPMPHNTKKERKTQERKPKKTGLFFPDKQQNPLQTKGYIQPNTWIEALNKRMNKHWKISKQWLNTLKNCLHKPFDQTVIDILSSA